MSKAIKIRYGRYPHMKRIILIYFHLFLSITSLYAQDRTVENRPYTDLRPFHFGILVGTHLQDLEFNNVGQFFVDVDAGNRIAQIAQIGHNRILAEQIGLRLFAL